MNALARASHELGEPGGEARRTRKILATKAKCQSRRTFYEARIEGVERWMGGEDGPLSMEKMCRYCQMKEL